MNDRRGAGGRSASLALFWGGVAAVATGYGALPGIVLLRGRLRARPVRADPAFCPQVTVVIAAHDEAASISAKCGNLLGLDYPADSLQIVIASDGSTDGTVDLARDALAGRATVLDLPRCGKAGALNAAIAEATGEVVVFTDANSTLDRDAIRAIVAPFADPEVGGVAGDQRYAPDGTGGVSEGERTYWSLDRALKAAESAAGSVVSATGALYAVRRALLGTVAVGVTDDFFTSTEVVKRGRRLVFGPDAVAREAVASESGAEYGRKVRVMTRGLRGVWLQRELLDPRRHGFYSVQLLWHKVLRRLMAVPLVTIAVATPALVRRGWLYRVAAGGQAAVYGLGALGVLAGRSGRRPPRLLAVPAYFCLVNVASLHALFNLVTGRRIDRWTPIRAAR